MMNNSQCTREHCRIELEHTRSLSLSPSPIYAPTLRLGFHISLSLSLYEFLTELWQKLI